MCRVQDTHNAKRVKSGEHPGSTSTIWRTPHEPHTTCVTVRSWSARCPPPPHPPRSRRATVAAAAQSGKGGKATAKKAPVAAKAAAVVKVPDSRFAARPKNLRVGGGVRVKQDVSRFVLWPRYVRIQRQRKVGVRRVGAAPRL